MTPKRLLSLALACALLVPALPARASENPVCDYPSHNTEDGHKSLPAEQLTPEALTAWAGQRKLTGLDPNHWAAPLLVTLTEAGLIELKDGDHVDLDAPVTLFQAAKVVMEWNNYPIEGLTPQEIAVRALELGLIPGPVPPEDRPMTRLEAAYMTSRQTGFSGTVKQEVDMGKVLSDWDQIPAESRDVVYWVTFQNRLFLGFEDRSFRPNETFTRGQFTAVQQRLRSWVSEQPPILQGGS